MESKKKKKKKNGDHQLNTKGGVGEREIHKKRGGKGGTRVRHNVNVKHHNEFRVLRTRFSKGHGTANVIRLADAVKMKNKSSVFRTQHKKRIKSLHTIGLGFLWGF